MEGDLDLGEREDQRTERDGELERDIGRVDGTHDRQALAGSRLRLRSASPADDGDGHAGGGARRGKELLFFK
jgi:hypothetical protein